MGAGVAKSNAAPHSRPMQAAMEDAQAISAWAQAHNDTREAEGAWKERRKVLDAAKETAHGNLATLTEGYWQTHHSGAAAMTIHMGSDTGGLFEPGTRIEIANRRVKQQNDTAKMLAHLHNVDPQNAIIAYSFIYAEAPRTWLDLALFIVQHRSVKKVTCTLRRPKETEAEQQEGEEVTCKGCGIVLRFDQLPKKEHAKFNRVVKTYLEACEDLAEAKEEWDAKSAVLQLQEGQFASRAIPVVQRMLANNPTRSTVPVTLHNGRDSSVGITKPREAKPREAKRCRREKGCPDEPGVVVPEKHMLLVVSGALGVDGGTHFDNESDNKEMWDAFRGISRGQLDELVPKPKEKEPEAFVPKLTLTIRK